MKLTLNKNIFIVEGEQNSAIYDLNKNLLYRVNKDAGDFLNSIQNESISINENELDCDTKKFLNNCINIGLISKESKNNNQNEIINNLLSSEIKSEFCWLEITSKCNQNCIHCFMADDLNKNFITFEKLKECIDGLYELGVKTIALSGGEPTLHPDFLDILEYINKYDIKIALLTNGSNINEEMINILKNKNVFVKIPLLGLENTHDFITGIKGSYKKTIASIKKLINANINLTISTTVMKYNINDMNELENFVHSLGLNFEKSPVYPIGNAKKNWDIVGELSYNEILKACNDICGSDFNNSKANDNINNKSNNFNTNIKTPINKYCDCGTKNIAINSSGKYIPCLLLRDENFNMGSINNFNIKDLLSLKNEEFVKVQTLLSYDNIDKCKRCECKFVCKGGGCRAVSYLFNDKVNDVNPFFNGCYYK